MPFEQGGLADKLGNRYEGRWIANRLLALINEEIKSVTVEAIGDDERGVDLWVEGNDGLRQAQQCKARNASKEFWSIADLNSRGILGHLLFQLQRNGKYEFSLISSVGSEVFNDICEFARRSGGDPRLFYEHKILEAGEQVQQCYLKFREYLGLENDQAFELLKRSSVSVYSDDQNAWQELIGKCQLLLTGHPRTNIASLIGYSENANRFGSPIYADELRRYLAELKVYPKSLSHDGRIWPAIEELQRQFVDSIYNTLINESPLERRETSQIIEAIEEQCNVIIHGAAGYGKSSVLYELSLYFKKNDIQYLPIRLDRKEPQNNTVFFGEQIGLPDCPANCLAAVVGERQSVLVLDQLDALR